MRVCGGDEGSDICHIFMEKNHYYLLLSIGKIEIDR